MTDDMTDNPTDVFLRVFDIQRFCLHDGPGIRTTVFLKGCPLFCPWCANPESQNARPELMHFAEQCAGCGQCAVVCPRNAVCITPETLTTSAVMPVFDRSRCTVCGDCMKRCPHRAISIAGYLLSIKDILAMVLKDAAYYHNTGGGITLSGGEPLAQPDGAASLLSAAKQAGFHTALETAASVPTSVFKRMLPYTDLFLIDLKLADTRALNTVTGAELTLVLQNLASAVQSPSEVIVRVPVIPGYNDRMEAMDEIFRLAAAQGVKKADLLAYHTLGRVKYKQLGRAYPPSQTEALSLGALSPYQKQGEAWGLTVTVNGK